MNIRKLLGLAKPRPKLIKRIRARAYPFTPAPRPFEESGSGRALVRLFEEGRERFAGLCEEMAKDADRHQDLARRDRSPIKPHWINGYLPPLDGMLLYTQLRILKPRTYLEIGSGTSTKFARKAIQDFGLSTKIVSIDPCPRAEIDALCDSVIRAPFQDVGERVLDYLAPGDMLFQDGSHHVFTNTDATVFFTEVLPLLPAGVVYGIHDIFLPKDYPEVWHRRFYNEQYLWASYVLARGPDRVEFPAFWASRDVAMMARLAPAFALPELAGVEPHGTSFWMRRG